MTTTDTPTIAIAPKTAANSYSPQRCADCPTRGPHPAKVWECEDGRLRCANHYAAHRREQLTDWLREPSTHGTAPRTWIEDEGDEQGPRLSEAFRERHGVI